MTDTEKINQKRQQCQGKVTQLELRIQELENQLNKEGNVFTDLDVIKHYLNKKFGFDFNTERTELTEGANKIKTEIRSIHSEIAQLKNCWSQHYPTKKGPHGKETGAACENCQLKPFYAEQAQQQEEIAKKQQEKAQREQESAELKKAKAANLKE